MSTSIVLPIKTQILDLLNARVELVPEILRVIHRPPITLDMETVVFPVAFTVDGDEGGSEFRNRLRVGNFPYQVIICCDQKQEDVSRLMDRMQADLFELLISSPSDEMRKFNCIIKEGGTPIDKQYYDEFRSGAVLNYTVEYRTDINSLYSKTY